MYWFNRDPVLVEDLPEEEAKEGAWCVKMSSWRFAERAKSTKHTKEAKEAALYYLYLFTARLCFSCSYLFQRMLHH